MLLQLAALLDHFCDKSVHMLIFSYPSSSTLYPCESVSRSFELA